MDDAHEIRIMVSHLPITGVPVAPLGGGDGDLDGDRGSLEMIFGLNLTIGTDTKRNHAIER